MSQLLLLLLLLLQGHLCGPGALLPGTTNTPAPAGKRQPQQPCYYTCLLCNM
jgi:hypothetical protein